jgi:hypothetical protein
MEEEEVGLTLLDPQPDLPPGPTYECGVCGTRIRTGQSHSAKLPHLHWNLAAMFARETAE